MKAILSMVSPCDLAADIGCDHGYIPIALVVRGICSHCIASDIRPGPASTAEQNAKEYGVSDRVSVRIGNGLETVRKADCIIISGMGGETILDILTSGKEKILPAQQLILGPQSEPGKVRERLASFNMKIAEELLICENGKYYPLIKAVHTDENYRLTEEEKLFGPELLRKKDPVLREYLIKREQTLLMILEGIKNAGGENSGEREKELARELASVKKALTVYET